MTQSNSYDVAVIGGGVAGSLAALNAVHRGCRVAWIRPSVDQLAQSLHWHGYLHRGHLYDPAKEVELIDALRVSNVFWDDARLNHYKDTESPWIVRYATSSPNQTKSPLSGHPDMTTDFEWMRSNENLLKGPQFLSDVGHSIEPYADVFAGLCMGHSFDRNHHKLVIRTDSSADIPAKNVEIRSQRIVVATGATNPAWFPCRKHRVRLGRMLVLSGANLPNLSFICPGEGQLNGLFGVSKQVTNNFNNTWLISDRFSSSAAKVERQDLLGGWWARSVALRLQKLLGENILHDARVGAYNAPKSSMRGQGHTVSSSHFDVHERSTAHLFPSKWTVSPLASVQIMQVLLDGRATSNVEHHFEAMAGIIQSFYGSESLPELWQSTPLTTDATTLTERSRSSIFRSGVMFRQRASTRGKGG